MEQFDYTYKKVKSFQGPGSSTPISSKQPNEF